VEHDRQLFLAFAKQITDVRQEDDPKLRALAAELAVIAAQAVEEGIGADDTRDRRQVLVFTYFADTVDWIVECSGRSCGRTARTWTRTSSTATSRRPRHRLPRTSRTRNPELQPDPAHPPGFGL